MDIPFGYHTIDQYCATLAHKVYINLLHYIDQHCATLAHSHHIDQYWCNIRPQGKYYHTI